MDSSMLDDLHDNVELPTPQCLCSEYMEWGRHDPVNHQRPEIDPISGLAPALQGNWASLNAPARPTPTPASHSRKTEPTPTEQATLRNLREILAEEGCKAVFTCAGRLPIVLHSEQPTAGDLTEEQRVISKPISIRFNTSVDDEVLQRGRILTIPTTSKGYDEAVFKDLLRVCQPATFGRNGEDVLDETYRRAGALDTDSFMTDFCPYQTGIIDVITQLLLPPIVGDLTPGVEPRRSDLAVKHNLTAREDLLIRHAITREMRMSNSSFTTGAMLPSLLDTLRIPPAIYADSLQKMESAQKLHSLRPIANVFFTFEDFYAFAAHNLRAKRLAHEQEHGIPQPERDDVRARMMCRGIRAELYKLNVYSGPRGRFKAHVDTPRSNTQIGSLVVCLPVAFEGGALAVRHQNQEVVHDWARQVGSDDASIQWAAFYSDVEHEVLEVTAGHRITLTYNLYLSAGSGLLAGSPLSLQASQLPLTRHFQSAHANPDFMPEGGYLGFMLAHSYPHTNRQLHCFVPSMLKGSDMALHEAVHATGLTSALEPIEGDLLPRLDALQDLDDMYLQKRGPPARADVHEATSHLAATAVVDEQQLGEAIEDDSDLDPDLDEEDFNDARKILNEQIKLRKRITWIGNSKHRELSKAYLVYGNQAELKHAYSKVALLVKVPSWAMKFAQGVKAGGSQVPT